MRLTTGRFKRGSSRTFCSPVPPMLFHAATRSCACRWNPRMEITTSALQADAEHINNRFNLLDFASLFSGTAIEPPRSYALRLTC